MLFKNLRVSRGIRDVGLLTVIAGAVSATEEQTHIFVVRIGRVATGPTKLILLKSLKKNEADMSDHDGYEVTSSNPVRVRVC